MGFGKWYENATKRSIQFLEYIAATVLVAMSLHIVVNALGRRLLRTPVEGTTEYIKFWYMPILVLVGILAAQYAHEHISARIFFDKLSLKGQFIVDFFNYLLMGSISILFAYFGAVEAFSSVEIRETGGIVAIPIWPIKLILPGFFFAFGLAKWRESLQMLKKLRGPLE